jgi:polysaccharide chain length determinant protein (PEP-CTERM system associated)
MDRQFPSSLEDFLSMMQRRWMFFAIPMLLVPVTVFFVGEKIPKLYRSETLIMIEPQKVPADYVKATVTSDITDRLQTIRQQVMSRTRLETVIHELNLEGPSYTPQQENALIDQMRKNITVEIVAEPEGNKGGAGAFRIAYLAPNPHDAQAVTQRVAQLFIDENLKQRDQQALGTDQFMTTQLEKAQQAMADQNARIQAFKSAHMGSLPEQEAANLQLISQQQALLESNDEALARASQQKTYLQSLLNIGQDGKSSVLPPQQSLLQKQLQDAKDQLAVAQRMYTDQHPDVIRLKRVVATLSAQVAHEHTQPTVAPRPSGPTATDQSRGQLASINQEIQERTARQKKIEIQIQQLQGRVESLPAVEQQFQALNQVYQTLKDNYDSLAKKQQSAAMANELEKHNDSEQFLFLDPPSLPNQPYWPNMLLLNLGGLCGGLVIGLAAVMIVEMKDQTLYTSEDVTRYLELPCLATVPIIGKSKGKNQPVPSK